MAISLLAIGITACGLLVFPSWGPQFADWLTAPEQRETSDAVFVLGGETRLRIETAIGLYQEGLSPHIYVTGDQLDVLTYTDNSRKHVRELAIALGIEPDAITLLVTSSTLEDAQAIRQVVQENHMRTITVVTNWYHSRRAMCTIRANLKDTEVHSVFVSADNKHAAQENWWENSSGRLSGLAEVPKLLFYALFYRIPMSDCWSEDWQILPFVLISVLGTALSVVLVGWVRKRALRKNILDIPNDRSSHVVPTPSSGGLGIVLTVLGVVVGLILYGGSSATILLPFMVTGVAIAALGWKDDQASLSAPLRLSLHSIIALVFVVAIGSKSVISVPILGDVTFAPLIAILVSSFIIVGLINAYNFMDGIDGLAAMQAIIAGSAWFVIFLLNGQTALALMALVLVVATIGFLYWNFSPAYIFMGDVGSTFLGFTLVALPLMAGAKGMPMSSRLLVTGLLFVGPFLFDSTLTIIRRLLKEENILLSHRTHLYQRLTTIGYSHAHVTTLYTGLFIFSALCGIAFYAGEPLLSTIAIAALLFVLAMLALGVTILERKRVKALSK